MSRGFAVKPVALFSLCAAVFLLLSSAVRAESSLAGDPLSVCVQPAEPGMTPEALFAHPEKFDCKAPQSAFGSGDFWMLSEPLADDEAQIGQPINIRTASVWQSRMKLYALYVDGEIVSLRTDQAEASSYLQLGAIIERTLPARQARLTRLLWHIQGAANLHGILNGVRITSPSESANSEAAMAAIYAGFGGLCLALLVYNLALWGALRHNFQIVYCAMVLCLAIYAFSSSGALAWLFSGIDNNDRLRLNYVLLSLSACLALLFARAFFERRVFIGWLSYSCGAAIALSLVAAAAFALLAPWHIGLLDLLNSLSYIPLLALIIPILWRAWSQHSRYVWLFAFAWSAPVVFAILRIAGNLDLISWNFWLDNSTILSMSLEALLSSLAIAYRIRLLSNERDAARIQENAARRLADMDPLTGLLNRRAFLREAIGRKGKQTLLVADLDNFKRVNDQLGHDGGDDVLRTFADILRDAVPTGALTARIGGEEFAIVVSRGVDLRPEEILERLRNHHWRFQLPVTASIGTCVGRLNTETDWNLLYRTADQALFDAKANGRDCVRAADPVVDFDYSPVSLAPSFADLAQVSEMRADCQTNNLRHPLDRNVGSAKRGWSKIHGKVG